MLSFANDKNNRDGNESNRKNDREEDFELVKKSQKNDVNAFEKIYRKYAGRIYALSLRMAGNPSIAEELVQEIFVRVWQKIHLFEFRSGFYTWMHRLAINLILNSQRNKLKYSDNEIKIDEISSDQAGNQNGRIDVSMDIEKAMQKLPAGAKEVFILYDVEGLQHDEIAQLKNISVSTSKSQLHRARKMLREELSYEL